MKLISPYIIPISSPYPLSLLPFPQKPLPVPHKPLPVPHKPLPFPPFPPSHFLPPFHFIIQLPPTPALFPWLFYCCPPFPWLGSCPPPNSFILLPPIPILWISSTIQDSKLVWVLQHWAQAHIFSEVLKIHITVSWNKNVQTGKKF